jgi:hypothetical protein
VGLVAVAVALVAMAALLPASANASLAESPTPQEVPAE